METITVVVISYNSSATVVETLDSIFLQNYPALELIISDDGSKDNTVALCNAWLLKNKLRFNRAELITVNKNSGIPSNLNRALRAVQTKWIKVIAADDMLLPNCIAAFSKAIDLKKDGKIFVSKVETFGDAAKKNQEDDYLNGCYKLLRLYTTSKQQYKHLLFHCNFIPAPSAFINTELIKNLGGFDESIKLLEDYPFWIKATRKGIKIEFVDETLVKYRCSPNSVQTRPLYGLSRRLLLAKYIYRNPFYYLINPFINQLNMGFKDRVLLTLMRLLGLPCKFIFKLKKRYFIKNS